MYPDNLEYYMPTDSERIVYHELKRQLPEDYSVFYSVKWSSYNNNKLDKSEADFIIESPEYGFLCLEVKGGSGIRVDSDTWFLIDRVHGERRLKESPYDQAEKSMYYFRNYFSNRYNTPYGGIFGAGVVFPFYAINNNIGLSERQRECTIDYSDMNDIHKRIKRMFRMWGGASYGHRYYTNGQHTGFLELIRERVAIAAAAGALVHYKELQLDTINRVQDNYIYFIKNVKQFYIRGGAGTGKTWIAMKMAKEAAINNGQKVLFLCKSKHLSKLVDGLIGDYVSVRTPHTLFGDENNYIDSNNELSMKEPACDHICEKEKYDAVFVDEAQDFSSDMAMRVRELLKDKHNSRLGIFYDDVQILQNESFGEGFGFLEKPFLLRENIRNTANIYKWAAEKTKLGMDVIVNPVEGPTPITEQISNHGQFIHYLEVMFRRYLDDEHLSNNSIVIIIDNVDLLMNELSGRIAKWVFVRRTVGSENEISVYTMEEFKGLESDMVIYIHDNTTTENENYIAYTRAKYYLIEIIRGF